MDNTTLIVMVLMMLTPGSAANQHNNVTTEMPVEVTATHGSSKTPGPQATPSTRADANQGTPTTHLSPQATKTEAAATPISSTHYAAINSTPAAAISSTEMSTDMPHTSGTRNPIKPSTALSAMNNSTNYQGTGMSLTSPATPPSQSTIPVQSFTPSIKPQRTTPPPKGAGTTRISSSYKTTYARVRPKTTKPEEETPHGKVVAGVIGGALVVMMLGFLVIYIKKRRLQQQQITSTDWAGPSPFLVGGPNNNQVTLRSSNRISLSSFLPQRLSKRLSLLPEADEELQDMSPGGTFGGKPQGSTFGQEGDEKDEKESDRSPEAPLTTDGKDGKESNGTAATPPPTTSSGEAEVMDKSSISETS